MKSPASKLFSHLFFRLVLATGFMLSAGSAQAQLLLSCNIASAPPMAFGGYNPLLFANHDAQTSMNVRCTGLGIAILRISMGTGLAGTVGARVMQRNGVYLPYGLYTNSGRTTTWGDGTAGTTVVQRLVFTGTDFSLPIYGRIPQRQNVPVGLYTDNVTIRLDF
ncbi:MAG: spore coat U domain-containing protein [Pseudomonadota bacterium]